MLKNIASLYALQIISYIIPLMLTPYLARVLGVESFGVLAICGTVIAYLSLLVNWGFDLSASQQVAQFADKPDKLRKIFWDTLLAKVSLGVIGFLLVGVITVFSPPLLRQWPTMLASSIALLASMFSVNWFLQGLEKMGVFAIASLAGRLLSIPITYLLVHSAHDTALAAGVGAAAACVSAVASIYGAAKFAPLGPMRIDFGGAYREVRGGTRLFLSTAAISLYTYTNLLIVGFIAGPVQAGLFDGADRTKRVGQSLTGPIGNAMYPRINNMMVNTPHRVPATMLWLLVIQGFITLVLTGLIYFGAPYLTVAYLGRAYAGSVPITKWLSLNVFLIGVSNVLGINMMLPLGMKRAFTWILMASGLVNVALLLPLTRLSGALGAAQAVTITEAIVTAAMGIWILTHAKAFWAAGQDQPVSAAASDGIPELWAHLKRQLPVGLSSHPLADDDQLTERDLLEAVTLLEGAFRGKDVFGDPHEQADAHYQHGMALLSLAGHIDPASEKDAIKSAVSAFMSALRLLGPSSGPETWGKVQTGLGAALQARAKFSTDSESQNDLRRAIRAFNEALRVNAQTSSAQRPFDDTGAAEAAVTGRAALKSAASEAAKLHFSLGVALTELGRQLDGEDRIDVLKRAVSSLREALAAGGGDLSSASSGEMHYSLGVALGALYLASGPGADQGLLEQGIGALDAALTVQTREEEPDARVMSQNSLGVLLATLGAAKGDDAGAEQLRRAVDIFRSITTAAEGDPEDLQQARINERVASQKLQSIRRQA